MLNLRAAPNPAYVVNRLENIISSSKHAKDISDKSVQTLKQCFDSNEILKGIRKFVASSDEQEFMIVPDYINKEKGLNICILLKRIEANEKKLQSNKSSDNDEALFFLTIVDLGFDKSNTELFQQTYKLTTAEVNVSVELASRKNVAKIASDCGASIGTIRSQVKMIKCKTNVADIPSVVRLLCGFSAGFLISSQLSNSPNRSADNLKSTPLKFSDTVT